MSPRKTELVAMLVVLGAVTVATAPRFRNGLVWDDLYVIEHGDVIHDWSQAPRVFGRPTLYATEFYDENEGRAVDTYRPITLLTFMVDSTFSGRGPTSYHVTNLLGHLACVVLVFLLARTLLREERRRLAPFAAAWFGLAPLLAEAHVWINGRSDIFCTLFGIPAVLAFGRSLDPARGTGARVAHSIVGGTLFLTAALCKEVALMLWPVLLFWPMAERAPATSRAARWGARAASLVPFALATVAYMVMRLSALDAMRAAGDGTQARDAVFRLPVLLLDGLFESIVPSRVYIHSMVDDYDLPPAVLIAAAVGVVALSIFVLVIRRRQPVLALSLVWFASTLAPAAIIATMLWPGFGRYLYLPAAGLFVGLTDALASLVEWRPTVTRIVRFGAIAYLVVLAVRLAAYTTDYETDDTLWGSVIRQAPESHHGYGWLGLMRVEHRRQAQAIEPLEVAVRRAPDEVRYLESLGNAYYATGRWDRAREVAELGVERFPPAAGSFHMLAVNCLNGRDPDATTEHLLECLLAEPSRPDCLRALRHAVTQHPLAPRYREVLRERARARRFSPLARGIARLLEEPTQSSSSSSGTGELEPRRE